MYDNLRQALKPVFTVDIQGNTTTDKKVCLLPGIYSTMKLIQDPSSKDVVLTYSDPSNLQNAGYACDQVMDDGGFNTTDGVKIEAVGRSKVRDFLNSVQRVGMRCTQIVIQNKLQNDQSIFDQQIELAKTLVGAKGGMDFITLQQYVNVNAYNERKITIDLSGVDEKGNPKALDLTPLVYMAINVPANSHFSMQFMFDGSASGI